MDVSEDDGFRELVTDVADTDSRLVGAVGVGGKRLFGLWVAQALGQVGGGDVGDILCIGDVALQGVGLGAEHEHLLLGIKGDAQQLMWVGCRCIHKAIDLVLELLWHNLEQVEALFGDLVGGDWLKVFSGQLCTDRQTDT